MRTSSGWPAQEKVLFYKTKGDYFRHLAEFATGARAVYAEATKVAEKDLVVTHPIRPGIVLNSSMFQQGVLQVLDEACKMALVTEIINMLVPQAMFDLGQFNFGQVLLRPILLRPISA